MVINPSNTSPTQNGVRTIMSAKSVAHVDEFFVGGEEQGKPGRSKGKKMLAQNPNK